MPVIACTLYINMHTMQLANVSAGSSCFLNKLLYLVAMATSQSESESCPKAKKPRRHCHFDTKWVQEFPGIARSSKGRLIS